MQAKNSKIISALFVTGGILFFIVTLGFYFQLPWATALWPWEDGRLSYIFIASITAAIAAPMVWIGLSGEFGAARGGAVNLGVTSAGTALYFSYLYSQNQELQLLISAVVSVIAVLANIVIFNWSRKIPIRDQRPMPALVKFSFVIFIAVLLLASTLLILRAAVIFPWPLKPESSVIFGLIFLGAAFYFLTALLSSEWNSARGQLLGFLAYDLVLIGPFLAHFNTVNPDHRLSLIIYTLVLVYSGALAIYFLFINKRTRSWRIQDSP